MAGGDFNFTFNVLPGDVAQANIVNVQSNAIITAEWLHTGYQAGDINGDGIVNTQDLAVVSANWLSTRPTGSLASIAQQSIVATDVSTAASETVSPAANSAVANSAAVAVEVAAGASVLVAPSASPSQIGTTGNTSGTFSATNVSKAFASSGGAVMGGPQAGNAVAAPIGRQSMDWPTH